ncbi:hypothetical protein CYMTET_39023 [Cymbomonas tetramitiformis]|uniref:Uncharacterized protein n=1 Tax=Cymbomonas tetramitiformis TaxID=36881 RepID=A0AAE0BGC0_9CHLO|nr:hypothetical protein CYMTET_54361 [Cymbomonas tetramitiformis]KAK3251639.1 hypothetical protein CYMTET_39023 [Cymbomonas tetramitiformis]
MGMDVTEGIALNPTPETQDGGGKWMKLLAFNLSGGPRHGVGAVPAFSPLIALAKRMDARTIKKIFIEIEGILKTNLDIRDLRELVRILVYDHDRAEDLAVCDFFFHKLPGKSQNRVQVNGTLCLIYNVE